MPQNGFATFLFNPFIMSRMIPLDSQGHSTVASHLKSATPEGSAKKSRATPSKNSAREALPSADDGHLCECLSAISKQDQLALGRLYDQTVSRVYSVALRIVRQVHLAEEVVSDVYMQVWRDALQYDASRGRVVGWLLIIARSRALDLLRRQDEAFSHPEPYDLVTESEPAQKSAQDLLEAAQAGSALHAAMEALTPLQRQLLSLAFFRGLSHSEIALHSEIPMGTVKTHIRCALSVLRKRLGPDT